MAMPAIASLRRSGIPVQVAVGNQFRHILKPFDLEYATTINHSISMETGYIHMQVTEYWLDKFQVEPVRHSIETDHADSVVVISPDSRTVDKRMPTEFWEEVVSSVKGEVVMIGPKDAIGYNHNLNKTLNVVDLTGEPLDMTFALLKHARAVVTTDTAISHLSDAMNRVTVTAFNRNNHDKFRPYWTPRVAMTAGNAISHLKELKINI